MVDHGEQLVRFSPILPASHLQVVNLYGDLRFLPDANRFLERRKNIVRLRAHMGDVGSSIGRHHLGHFDEFLRVGIRAWRINQCRRKAECAIFHGFPHRAFHQGEFFGCCLAGGHALRESPDRPLPGKGPKVHARTMRLHRTKPAGKSMRAYELTVGFATVFCARRSVGTTLSHNLRRKALRNFTDDTAIPSQQRVARVRLYVDEAWRENQASFGIDLVLGLR